MHACIKLSRVMWVGPYMHYKVHQISACILLGCPNFQLQLALPTTHKHQIKGGCYGIVHVGKQRAYSIMSSPKLCKH